MSQNTAKKNPDTKNEQEIFVSVFDPIDKDHNSKDADDLMTKNAQNPNNEVANDEEFKDAKVPNTEDLNKETVKQCQHRNIYESNNSCLARCMANIFCCCFKRETCSDCGWKDNRQTKFDKWIKDRWACLLFCSRNTVDNSPIRQLDPLPEVEKMTDPGNL